MESIEQLAAKFAGGNYVKNHEPVKWQSRYEAYISSYQTHCLPLIEENEKLKNDLQFFQSEKHRLETELKNIEQWKK